jgi:hypothetical protein
MFIQAEEITPTAPSSASSFHSEKDININCITMPQSPIPTATLYNGYVIPLIGLGCASGVREEHVTNALNIGYTFFDTAQSYNWCYHEDEVGTAISNYRSTLNRNSLSSPKKIIVTMAMAMALTMMMMMMMMTM